MRPPRAASMLLIGLFFLGSCSSEPDPFATDAAPTNAPFTSGEPNRERDDPPTPAKRPRPGEYVYEIVGIGATQVPSGTVIRENLSVEGDLYTIDVTNSANDNRQQIKLRWEEKRVVQLSNDIVVNGRRFLCTYEPPLELLRNPVRAEGFPKQEWDSTTCEENIRITVVERTSIKDKKGKTWDTWMIQVRLEGRGRLDEETRYFSPELGRDIRIETATETATEYRQSARVLSSYPGPV